MESANRELVQALRLLNETGIDDFKELMTLVALDPLKDLQGADLSRANLSEADLSGAKLIESTLDADSSSDSSVA